MTTFDDFLTQVWNCEFAGFFLLPEVQVSAQQSYFTTMELW